MAYLSALGAQSPYFPLRCNDHLAFLWCWIKKSDCSGKSALSSKLLYVPLNSAKIGANLSQPFEPKWSTHPNRLSLKPACSRRLTRFGGKKGESGAMKCSTWNISRSNYPQATRINAQLVGKFCFPTIIQLARAAKRLISHLQCSTWNNDKIR